jgi:hypothetical protein
MPKVIAPARSAPVIRLMSLSSLVSRLLPRPELAPRRGGFQRGDAG